MKKLAVVLLVAVASFCLASSAFAGSVSPGAVAKCTDAKSITVENKGGGAGGKDWGDANATIWFSSTHLTTAISLSPNSNQSFTTDGGGAAGNKQVKMASKHSMGKKSVTFNRQNNFSRGDSISDINGVVKITNTGTAKLTVTCG